MAISFKKSPFLHRLAGDLFTAYVRLIAATSRIEVFPATAYEDIAANSPAIFALWHGEHFLVPVGYRPEMNMSVLISKSADGAINARVAENYGIGLVRGSGSPDPRRSRRKAGTQAFLNMLKRLKAGGSMVLTADVPKISRVAGDGIILLAQKSGRPIFPLAIASSRFIRLNSWDKAALNLPFSKLCYVLGKPIYVPQDADSEALEILRQDLQQSLDETTRLAYEQVSRNRKDAAL